MLQTGRDAAASVLAHWERLSALGVDVVMVGLGVEETEGLNRAALSLRFADKKRESRFDTSAGRYPKCPGYGSRVVMLSGRVSQVPYGTRGTVIAEPTDKERASVLWDGHSAPISLEKAGWSHLGYGYAVTASVAARTTGQLVVLGPREAVPVAKDRILEWVIPRADITMSREMGQQMSHASSRESGREITARALGR